MQTLDQYPQYECVGVLKETDKKQARAFRNTELDRMIVERILHQHSSEVYQKLSGILHPNLLEIYEAIQDGEDAYILEEYFDGITLSEILKDRTMKKKEARRILISVCNALEALHANGIIHRDVKSQNIMIDSAGNVKLIDYDIARLAKEFQESDTTVLGTVGFAAPEQFGIAQSNERSDIYAVGVLMNLMLTGDHPSVRLCSGRAGKIVRKCTMTENTDRYRNVLELKKALLLW